MKTNIKLILSFVALSLVTTSAFSQTTAMNFTGVDCNNNPVDLFADLDAGKAVILHFYMPNCGSCPPPAQKIQAMANKINATNPGLVKAYAFPFQNSTTCSAVQTWVTNNSLPLYAPMDSGAVQVAYYGGFGMPTVVLLGGNNRDVLFVSQNFVTSDTTTMRDLILGMSTSGVNDLSINQIKLDVFPNPSSDQLIINFNSPFKSEYYTELMDINGKSIMVTTVEQINEGENSFKMDVSKVPSGTYFVTVHVNDIVKTQKVNISH